MKILSPSENPTAANKNLPDFHQATWARVMVMYDFTALPDVLSSVLFLCFSLLFIPSKRIRLSFCNIRPFQPLHCSLF